MPRPVYTVVLQVEEASLPTILGALAGSITLVSVTATEEAAPKRTVEDRHYVNFRRNKGIRGHDLVIKVLTEHSGICSGKDFSEAFKHHGFAITSWSPIISKLTTENKIRRLGNDSYALPGTVIKKGADA